MSYYYKYKFTSPEPTFALVQEELKSYFDTNAVDTVLFPKWTEWCLKALGKSAYPIAEALLCIDTFESRLPDDFYAVREAWACENYESSYKQANSMYTEIKQESVRVDEANGMYCQTCDNCEMPDIITAIYKTTNTVAFQWKKQYLLTPGNTYPACPKDLYCANYNSIAENSYDVRDNKFVTTFREGNVYIQYYSEQFDCDNQLVPDEYRALKYIEQYLKSKVFEQLANQTTDETFSQIQQKYLYYKQLAEEAYIIATTEAKKEDVYRKQRAIKRTQNRFKKYIIR